MKTTMVLNFIRSAKAPQIKAGVMTKNIPWKSMWVSTGIVPMLLSHMGMSKWPGWPLAPGTHVASALFISR